MKENEKNTAENAEEEILETQEEQDVEAAEASLEEDLMKMRETAMRTAAEYDNYRKRAAREKEDIIRYANQRLLEELLPILDNFDMGMQAAKVDESSMVYIGMSMVQKQLADFLANQGLVEVPAENQMFDHNLHEAVERQLVGEEVPEGKILRVTRRGYKLRDRLVRAASVVVAHHGSEEKASS